MPRIAPVGSTNVDSKVAAALFLLQVKASLDLSTAEARKARTGNSDDFFERALTSFAKDIVRDGGLVSDQDLAIARKAGIDDSLMLEIVANIALNTLTNYANRLADPEIDFPVVQVNL
ncbi:carboxymuconolactone decarboxylase family protein [Edaphobacter bradus]|uniref:hypothetical protein n=1 Tax=Edaphobacter bradus TaxID=2259016 RepID=UPI0021DFBFF5|nr:hypothetical protein [Edaphobacter bradus]